MDQLETAIPRNPSHNRPPNADTIEYTSKILLKGQTISFKDHSPFVIVSQRYLQCLLIQS
jgi:hypothetical protein